MQGGIISNVGLLYLSSEVFLSIAPVVEVIPGAKGSVQTQTSHPWLPDVERSPERTLRARPRTTLSAQSIDEVIWSRPFYTPESPRCQTRCQTLRLLSL